MDWWFVLKIIANVALEIGGPLIATWILERRRSVKDEEKTTSIVDGTYVERRPGRWRRRVLMFLACFAAAVVLVEFLIPGVWHRVTHPGQKYADAEVSFFMDGAGKFAQEYVSSPDFLVENDGVLYLWDSGRICELHDDRTDVIPVENYSVSALQAWKGDVYLLTEPWLEGQEWYFTILRVRGENDVRPAVPEAFHAGTDTVAMRFTDFALSNNGKILWLIRQDMGIGSGNICLERMTYDPLLDCFTNQEWFLDLQWDITDQNRPRITVDSHDNLYISAPEDHVVLILEDGAQSYDIFAGKEEEASANDGKNPTFLYPTSLTVRGDYLYVYDSGSVRRLSLETRESQTMAGKALEDGRVVVSNPDASEETVSGKDARLPCGAYPGFAVNGKGEAFLCDASKSAIYQIKESVALES